MYAFFAWRYFKSKKSTGAIQIISRLSLCIIAFATCCQLLVLSVYNGFEDIVQTLYASFYADLKVVPAEGKYFLMDQDFKKIIQKENRIKAISGYLEEKALLKHGDVQTVVKVRGVDDHFLNTSGVPQAIRVGKFNLGNAENPGLVMGAGVQYAANVNISDLSPDEPLVLIMSNKNETSGDLMSSLSEAVVSPTGSFSIQQDFDNYYSFTNISFLCEQLHINTQSVNGVDIKVDKNKDLNEIRNSLQRLLGKKFVVQTRQEQNMSLYRTMKTEKWVIFAVLTFILIIAAFNIISAMSMLVIEKRKDIHILRSLGSSSSMIRSIFLSEGVLLGVLGTVTGVLFALALCFMQLKWKWLKISGGTFMIDYFPVKMLFSDILVVVVSALMIVILASWLPANKAAQSATDLK